MRNNKMILFKQSFINWSVSIFIFLFIVCFVNGMSSQMAFAVVPDSRIDYAFEYSPVMEGILMHGGWGPSNSWAQKNELWMVTAPGWVQLNENTTPWKSINSPSAVHHTMTYDILRQVMVTVFNASRSSSTPSFQTWEYNGSTWTRKQDVPITIDGDAAIAYDQNRNVVVLYAASWSNNNVVTLEYNGTLWTTKITSKSPVKCSDRPLLKYHPVIGKTVYVGRDLSNNTSPIETWTWDGDNWTQIAGTQPPSTAVPFGGMSYDTNRGEIILLTRDMQTWGFDGYSWNQKLPPTSPSPNPNGFFSLAYDQTRALTLFFGGEAGNTPPSYPTKTWTYNGTTWSDSVFSDVPSSYLFHDNIISIYNARITRGCLTTPLSYCPEQSVSRGQMAAFITRAKFTDDFTDYTLEPYFTDVPADHVFFKYVQKMKDMGYTSLTGVYDVNGIVTRGQMAAFIIRAKHGEAFSFTETPYFTDVPADHIFFKYVQKMKDMGYTAVSGVYDIDGLVTRGQMAAFIDRAFLKTN